MKCLVYNNEINQDFVDQTLISMKNLYNCSKLLLCLLVEKKHHVNIENYKIASKILLIKITAVESAYPKSMKPEHFRLIEIPWESLDNRE